MRIRHAKLVTALLTTTALGLGAIEIQANLVARADLQRFLTLNPGVSVASIYAEPLTGHVTLHGVSAGTGMSRISIGTLDLPLPRQNFHLIGAAAASPFDDKPGEPQAGKADQTKPDDESKPDAAAPPAPTAEAPAASGSGTASADNVTITNGSEVYRIKHIDVTGTTLTNADLASLLDVNSPEPIEVRLKKLTATAIVVPEIRVDDTTAGSDRHAVFSQLLLSGVTAGRITAASLASTTLTLKNGDEDDTGSVGAIQASGVDLPQIVHVFSSVRTDDAEPILPLYDSLTLTSLKIANPKKNVFLSLATLKETGIKGRPLKTDAITAKKAGSETLTDAQKKALLEDMSQSFEVGSIEATDFAGRSDLTTTFSIASVSIQDLLKSKVGGFSLRALRLDAKDGKFGIGSMDVGPITIPPPKSDATTSRGDDMPLPSSAKIDLNQIDFDTKIDGTDPSGAPNRLKFKMAHAGFVSDGSPGDIPTTVKTTLDNITFDVPPAAGQAQPIYQMGYRKLDISMGLATIYDPANQSLKIHDFTLNGVSMGSIALGLHLVNVTKGLVSSNQEVVKASAMAILAKGIALDVVNDGLVDKALAWKAKQDGMMDVTKEKEFLIDFFDVKLPASLNNSANVKIVGSAVAKFVAEPKNLHISVESKSGLGIGSMALLSDPGLLIDSLDVKATANQ